MHEETGWVAEVCRKSVEDQAILGARSKLNAAF